MSSEEHEFSLNSKGIADNEQAKFAGHELLEQLGLDPTEYVATMSDTNPESLLDELETRNAGNRGEQNTMKIEARKLNDGLGYGDGTISAKEREKKVGSEVLAKADEVIKSSAILVDVDTDEHGQPLEDDGCGDGRGWVRVSQWLNDKYKVFRRSLNRYKVFGGGATMVAAARIGAGMSHGRTAEQNFADSVGMCANKGIGFGAHTDEHADGNPEATGCGCGAIDKNPQIVAAAGKYREQIIGGCEALGVDTNGIEEVFDNYAAYSEQIAGDTTYAGRKVMDLIVRAGKIVKRLSGGHVEARIVANTVAGKTVNQTAVRKATGGKVDVFGFDVPRMQQIADLMSTDKDGVLDEVAAKRAFQSMAVYTLATAAVLTKGDLPVWVISQARVEEPALVAA